ncbi:MAG TPA: transcription termination factor Rho, partial [Firmicutes bacterium]|nr:transcription termination factor Rho [Bacillota bacterium]
MSIGDLGKKTLPELRDIGKRIGLKGVSRLHKAELIEAIGKVVSEHAERKRAEAAQTNGQGPEAAANRQPAPALPGPAAAAPPPPTSPAPVAAPA